LQTVVGDKAEIVVVDDASTDETAALLESLGSCVKVVRHSSNSGFSTSCNDGASAASGDYLLFLNNDTIPLSGWLEELVTYADAHPRAAVVGSKLLYSDLTIQHAGVVICQDWYPRHIYTGFPSDHPAVNRSRQFQIVTAACMLVRRAVFAQAGGFDTHFRNGFEDVDFCLRLREAGHEVHYCAQSVVQHLESVSPGRFRNDRDNVTLYRERWFGRVRPDDINYYLEDGLLQLSYEGSFPIEISVSPRLAVLDSSVRASESEQLLTDQARQIADLRREKTRLSLHVVGSLPESEAGRYEKLRHRIHETVALKVPAGSTVLVVSKGDGALVDLQEHHGWHFPQTAKGAYAGHHPADSFNAISQLETLRSKGAQYLLFPKTAFWWLEHYRDLDRHLTTHYPVTAHDSETCLIFDLRQRRSEPVQSAGETLGAGRNPASIQTWDIASARAVQPAVPKETKDSK
jgi:GT2 family glycosyltransferase